ncbi:uncharacterized protein LOC127286170 isoform X2 [Leptopilina boulardi]|uniref:uncharacterized protein LOC127286170 isoform X2 n=1 Tax=Leptopilina boulardi TaxID=63433 RepID=UPI0021F5889C|nr:uncharacterized protein LOC127286170 isoform X2 [Leptopilina boulardi]
MDKDLKPVENNKEFAVVKFLQSENELEHFSEVLVKWLRFFEDDKKRMIYKCWWPPNIMNVTSLILKKSDHDPALWSLLEVDIAKFCFRKMMKVRDVSSNQRVSYNSDEDQERSVLTYLPSEPDFNTEVICSRGKNLSKDSTKQLSIHTDDMNQLPDSRNLGDIEKLQNSLDQTNRTCAHLRLEVKDLKRRFALLEQGNHQMLVYNDLETIKALLPLKKVSHVDQFNKKLKNSPETKLLLEKYIQGIGGASAKDNIYNVLKATLSNRCCKHYTCKGMKDKPAASKLRLMTYIKYFETSMPFENIIICFSNVIPSVIIIIKKNFIALICSSHPSLKEADFDTIAAECFQETKRCIT